LPGKGVKINHIYYWSEMFLDPEVEKTRVPVRYDPYDASRAYAYVGGQWVGCISEHSAAFEGRSEKEIKIATEELRQQLKQYSNRSDITARKLADFVTSVEAEELEALAVQRMRDAEAQTISKIKEGGRRASAKIEKSTEECRRQTKENNPDQVGDKTEEFEIEVYGRF
jgi:putative transposase